MMNYQSLRNAISKFAWGYFFLYFNINIGTLNILPSFIGYLLFLSAINDLQKEEKSIALLKPFATILLVWNVICWCLEIFSVNHNLVLIALIIGIIDIYFHFQALTNIASIAYKYQIQEKDFDRKLLKLRTVQTATLTVITCAGIFKASLTQIFQYASIVLVAISLIVSLSIMFTMFSFRKNIDQNKFQTSAELSDDSVIKPVDSDTEE